MTALAVNRDYIDASEFASLQTAVDYAIANKRHVLIPNGTYTITSTLNVDTASTDWLKIEGQNSIIQAGAGLTALVKVPDLAKPLEISGLVLNGANQTVTYGLELNNCNSPMCKISHVETRFCTHGFYLNKCQSSTLEFCDATLNTQDGYRFNDCNNLLAHKCRAINNGYNGFKVWSTDNPGSVTIQHCSSEGHGVNNPPTGQGHGFWFAPRASKKTYKRLLLLDCWAEQNTADVVRIETDNVVAIGNQLSVKGRAANRGIKLLGAGYGNDSAGVRHCRIIANTVTDVDTPARDPVEDQSGHATNYIAGNQSIYFSWE